MPDRDDRGSAWKVPPSRYLAGRPAEHRVGAPASVYVTMADGCRLAVDVILPDGDAAQRWPTVLILTPYVRRFELAAGSNIEPSPNSFKYRDMFVPRGYALVVVDARGTGASFGTRDSFRSPRERADYRAIADWIVAQQWSDGRIGATGISYLGAACDFLASTGHPAVKAIAPLFAVWDTWADNYYPGGMLIKRLALVYDELMLALDHDRRDLRGQFKYFADPALQGPMPVDDDKDGALAREAVKGHLANFRMPDFITEFKFRDDALPYDPSFTSASFSPYNYLDEMPKDVAVYAISGWMDGAGYANGTLSRFLTLPNAQRRVMLGPWDHGARVNASPWRARVEPELPVLGEVLRFFDEHLAGRSTGLRDEDPIHYFTVHAEEWRSAKSWPPVNGNRQFFTAPGRQLAAARPNDGTTEPFQADFTLGSGTETRYERIAGIDAVSYYADWTEREAQAAGLHHPAARQAARDRRAPRGVAVALLERTRRGGVRLSLRGRGRRHVALRHRGCPARHPSRRGAGAAQLPHDLAVAQLRPQGRAADAGRRAAAPALRPAADGVALRGGQPPQALDRRRRRRPFRADAARPAAAPHVAERRRTRERARPADE